MKNMRDMYYELLKRQCEMISAEEVFLKQGRFQEASELRAEIDRNYPELMAVKKRREFRVVDAS
ncbi:hypothetical protein ACFTRE_17735 [Bacillus subtilis]|uniref:hypothetical protein n=1 Tax=Bacillati TaxID=1783272 RepID=UPI001B8E2A27|nr:hypothetical protein [Bacillus subtilis]MCY8867368.1 hypothetical protein [Bacillus spizizenii]MCY8902926.1 hypothetical protein [Bacillus spizizenii]MCY8907049.1 hypothetical protein [Bacillus spizizenii]CAF1778385.1 hypothetical protein NRS6094_04355 [Bacillus subtilis]